MLRPSSVNFVDSFPPGGSLDEGKMKTYPLSSAYADTFPDGESKGYSEIKKSLFLVLL